MCREKIPNLSKGQLPSRSYEGQTPEPFLALVPPSLLTADPARALGIPAPPCFFNSSTSLRVSCQRPGPAEQHLRPGQPQEPPRPPPTPTSSRKRAVLGPRAADHARPGSHRLTHLTLPALPMFPQAPCQSSEHPARSSPKPTGKCSKAENLTAWNALADSPGDSLRLGSLPPSP